MKIFIFIFLINFFIIFHNTFAEEISNENKNNDIQEGKSVAKNKIDAKGKKITVINFEDTNIEGQYKIPNEFFLQSKNSVNFKNILELRKDFRLQILNSVNSVIILH